MNIGRILWPRRLAGKMVALTCAFFVVLITVYQIAVWSLARQLEALIEADRQNGLPTTIAEAYGPPVPESENAETPLIAAAAISESLQRQARQETFGTDTPDPRTPWPRDRRYLLKLGRLLEAHPAFDGNIVDALARPHFLFASRPEDPRGVTRTFANPFADVLRGEAARSLCEMEAGRRDSAIERLIRLYRFARRGYEAAPFFDWWNIVNNVICHDVHWAIDQVLISGNITDRTRDGLDEALSLAEDNLRSAASAHQGQKLFLLDNYKTYGAMPWWADLPPIELRSRIDIAKTMSNFAPREPSSGKTALAERGLLMQERRQMAKSKVYQSLFLAAYNATLNETFANYVPFREIAHARCLRVLNALQRHGGTATDAASLGLPPAAVIDPFTEEPLKIIKTKSGWVVYSLGENQKDLTAAEIASGFRYVVGFVHELPKPKK